MTGNPYIDALILILSMMTIVYIISLLKNDYSVIDIFWPVGFGLLAYHLLDFEVNINLDVVKIFVTIWCARLCVYLAYRNIIHGPDMRYRELQNEWGKHHRVHAFLKVFMLQGGFMYLIGLPIITGTGMAVGSIISLYIGAIIAAIGFGLELIADIQLYSFKQKAENKGKYLMTGLFQFSRHPNYLGEILFWVGIAVLVMPNPASYLTCIGPLVLTFALYKFSGVPYAERNQRKTGPYLDYAAKTGAIFPRLW